MRNFPSPIVEVRRVTRENYEDVLSWCDGTFSVYKNKVEAYVGTYRTESGTNSHTVRLDDIHLDKPTGTQIFDQYIAKMENSGFLWFMSISLESALQEIS